MGKVILITGGARSGKSTFAETLALEKQGKILYVATAKAIDEEMKDRIRRHQERRPDHWDTLEQYKGLQQVDVYKRQENAYSIWGKYGIIIL